MTGETYAQKLVANYSGAKRVSTMWFKSGAGDAARNVVLHAQKITGKKAATVPPDDAKELTEGKTKEFLGGISTHIDLIPP